MAPQVQAYSAGVRGVASLLKGRPGPRPAARVYQPSPVSGPPRGRAAPRPWQKSFQIALLGSDWPRRTRSRGGAANERRGLRAAGQWRGPEVWAAPPSAAAAVALAASLRRPRPGKCRTTGAAGGEGRWETLLPRPAARCTLGTPGSRPAETPRLS